MEAPLNQLAPKPPANPTMSTRLVVGIDEAIGEARGLPARTGAIVAILDEINESVRWLHQPGTGAEELASLALVVEAVRRHASRMAQVEPSRQP